MSRTLYTSESAFEPISTVPPFLKWAGGKRWLVPILRTLGPRNFGRYIEPFLGSGAIFFALQPESSELSDTNAELVETFAAIRDDWGRVYEALAGHQRKHSEMHYYAVRAKNPRSAHGRAARFIYLNRTCWNGLFRVNRRGVFNVPKGTKVNVLLASDDFESTSKLLKNAKIVCGDFEKQIDRAKSGDFVFADPPYTVKHNFNGFIKYNETLFSWDDQVRLHQALTRARSRGAFIVATNADHSSIRELYEPSFTTIEMDRFSSIAGAGNRRGRYSELIILG